MKPTFQFAMEERSKRGPSILVMIAKKDPY